MTCLIDNDVAGFEIPVNETALMRMMDGIADLGREFQPLARVQVVHLGVAPQGLAPDEFHREEGLPPEGGLRHPRLVDLRDAGMLQEAQCL